jgi:hypothetical protein
VANAAGSGRPVPGRFSSSRQQGEVFQLCHRATIETLFATPSSPEFSKTSENPAVRPGVFSGTLLAKGFLFSRNWNNYLKPT